MHTSMKTWSFLSNYKGVCWLFLWGCPAALPTLWGLCFSYTPTLHIFVSLPLSLSASVHHLNLTLLFFLWTGERDSFIYSFAFHLPFVSSNFCQLSASSSSTLSLSPTHTVSLSVYGFWVVSGEKTLRWTRVCAGCQVYFASCCGKIKLNDDKLISCLRH